MIICRPSLTFIDEAIRNKEIDEFLEKKLDKAGFGGAEVARPPWEHV